MKIKLSYVRSTMNFHYRYLLCLLGTGVCVILLLKTMDFWTHFTGPDPENRNTQMAPTIPRQPQIPKLLSPEQILRDMNSSLVGSRVQDPLTTRHVLAITYFRGGSTFVGDLLQQNWKTFYTYEPLRYLNDGIRITETQVVEAFQLLKDLMYCNFSTSWFEKYLKWATNEQNNYNMYRNKFLYLMCSINTEPCLRLDFVQYLCNRAPWQVMKLNRLSVEKAGRFVRDNPELDIRVLHLVRDPRAIFSSRKERSWCKRTAECIDFKVLCKEMEDDYKAFQRLKELYPQKFFQVRYEDLASRPKGISKQIFAALDFPYTETITNFLNHNTKDGTSVQSNNPYSTNRNSYKAAFEWRNNLTLEVIMTIQAECANVLTNYDYRLVNSSLQLQGSPQAVFSSQRSWLIR